MNNDSPVFIAFNKKAKYPTSRSYFNPSQKYPEYLWGDGEISKETNSAYDLVRQAFHGLGLDKENYGKKNWNPLKEIVQPGMKVLIKPNMVLSADTTGLDPKMLALVTHPSLVRAAVDYALIALKGEGSVTIADAPLQSCNFQDLVKAVGYDKLIHFYKKQGIIISLVDLRQYTSRYREDNYLEPVKASCDPKGYSVVDMSQFSAHAPIRTRSRRFRVTNYDHRKMKKYHDGKKDSYLIANTVLASDVIISLPKIKTHRKSGMTGALKNFIGIIGHKDCLPHHSTGSKHEGGDEYLHTNIYKKMAVRFIEYLNLAMIAKRTEYFAYLSRIIYFFEKLALKTRKDPFSEGSWYGNDTIWRTTLDLDRIALYGNKKGIVKKKKQRQVFSIADMIVGGEKEGPLHPTAKKAGVVAVSLDQVSLDAALATIMGFDYTKIPTIREGFQLKTLPITKTTPQNLDIRSNNPLWDTNIASIPRKNSLAFVPSDGWKEHIEREG